MTGKTEQIKSIVSSMNEQIKTIASLYDVAEPLRAQYIADMQKDSGYNALTASSEFMSMIASGEVTQKGIIAAIAAGKIEKVSTKPSDALIDAIRALTEAKEAFLTLSKEAMLPYNCEVKSTRKTGTRGTISPGISRVLSIDPTARIELIDVGMSHPHVVGTLSNGARIDIDCYAGAGILEQHVNKALGTA
jgi:hypothetical protein